MSAVLWHAWGAPSGLGFSLAAAAMVMLVFAALGLDTLNDG